MDNVFNFEQRKRLLDAVSDDEEFSDVKLSSLLDSDDELRAEYAAQYRMTDEQLRRETAMKTAQSYAGALLKNKIIEENIKSQVESVKVIRKWLAVNLPIPIPFGVAVINSEIHFYESLTEW